MYTASEDKIVLVQNEEYKEYMEAATTGVIYFDNNKKIKNINLEAERICSLRKGEILGKCVSEVFEKFGKRFLRIFSCSENKEVKSMTVCAQVDAKQVYLHLNLLKVIDSTGNVAGNVLMIQDVSALKAAIKQIQTTKMLISLGEVAAGVAHHVRTPLTTISGYLQLMIGRLENDKYTVKRDVLEGLLGEVSYIDNIVKELVMFAKPPIAKKPGVDIGRCLSEALRMTFKELGCEKIAIKRQIVKELPTINADENFLQQALVNILQNALESMGDTGVLTVKTWRDYEINMLVISIGDTGSGIAPEILPRIFEPFYTSKLDRMGLGLPIAHRIVFEHNGFINISLPQNSAAGTVVKIYLPIIEKEDRIHLIQQQVLNLQ